MTTFAHIINPVIVLRESSLFIAQPITFETIRTAQKYSRGHVKVDLFSAQYPEDSSFVPEGFHLTKNLTQSVLDFGAFKEKRRLPLIKDILDRLYEATDADYMIYTNVDIALMPFFYIVVNRIIEEGYDAFIINRRTISKTFERVEDIPLMYSQVGEKHRGYDCFVFKRSAYPEYQLGNTCIGTGRVGAVLAVNLIYNAKKFKEFTDLHATFHIGNDKVWKSPHLNEYFQHNQNELKKVLQYYDVLQNPLDYEFIKKMVVQFGKYSIKEKVLRRLLRWRKKAGLIASILNSKNI
jgi:hypothetical protein